MAYNPFLSMNEPVAPITTEASNPFMMTETDVSTFAVENPFTASNPFSDFGGYEPPAGDTVPVDIFGGTEPARIGAKHDFDVFGENDESTNLFSGIMEKNLDRPAKPTDLDLVSMVTEDGNVSEDEFNPSGTSGISLLTETQNLILSVTGQMEFTSSHLLNRIPPTRTPSPVSVRDIHSPSPTPELEGEVAPPLDTFDINRNRPARPPPARPPPVARRPPPRPTPPVAVPPRQPPPPHEADDINLFDAPVPGVVKPTKEAILSLYSAPKQEEKQIDFLSDDILEQVSDRCSHAIEQGGSVSDSFIDSAVNMEEPKRTEVTDANTLAAGLMFSEGINSEAEAVAAPMDCSEPVNDLTSAIPNVEGNPFECNDDVEATVVDATGDLFGTNESVIGDTFAATPADAPSDEAPSPQTHPRQEAALGADPGWGDPVDVPMQDAFAESQDEFDMFSAKFDSTTADHRSSGMLLNILKHNTHYFINNTFAIGADADADAAFHEVTRNCALSLNVITTPNRYLLFIR